MKEINITVGSALKSFSIGRRGENEATQIVFDVSALVSQYGDGTCVLMAKRPSDTNAYPVTVTRDGNAVTWLVSEVDTQYRGTGEAELFWYVGETLAKSIVYTTQIGRDIGQASATPPDPYETWLDTLTEAAAAVTAAMEAFTGLSAAAETLPAGSDATASYEDGVLNLGIPQGDKGDPGVSFDIVPSVNAVVYDPNAAAGERLNPAKITLSTFINRGTERSTFLPFSINLYKVSPSGTKTRIGRAALTTSSAEFDLPANLDPSYSLLGTCLSPATMDATAQISIPIVSAGVNGQDGAAGPQGETGPQGPAGPGVPSGGAAGQVLVKQSAADYDAAWGDSSSDIFWATYGTTTYAEVSAAYYAGKEVLVEVSSGDISYILRLTELRATLARFGTTTHTKDIHTARLMASNDSWTYESAELQKKNMGSANVGKFLVVGSDGDITAVTMQVWLGGSY